MKKGVVTMTKRRSSPKIISQLIGLIAPLKLQMTLAILLGVLGFLLSFGIGILGGYGVLSILPGALQTYRLEDMISHGM